MWTRWMCTCMCAAAADEIAWEMMATTDGSEKENEQTNEKERKE